MLAWYTLITRRGDVDVIGVLEDVCEEAIQATDFFHGGPQRSATTWVRIPH